MKIKMFQPMEVRILIKFLKGAWIKVSGKSKGRMMKMGAQLLEMALQLLTMEWEWRGGPQSMALAIKALLKLRELNLISRRLSVTMALIKNCLKNR
jgi:hypothetical protein